MALGSTHSITAWLLKAQKNTVQMVRKICHKQHISSFRIELIVKITPITPVVFLQSAL